MIEQKKGRHLAAGDKVKTEEGEVVRITSVTRGMIEDHVLVHWREGWGHIHHKDVVEVFK